MSATQSAAAARQKEPIQHDRWPLLHPKEGPFRMHVVPSRPQLAIAWRCNQQNVGCPRHLLNLAALVLERIVQVSSTALPASRTHDDWAKLKETPRRTISCVSRPWHEA